MYIRREIHALTRIRHSGVVRIREQGVVNSPEGGDIPWYAMDYVEGTSLSSCMRKSWESQQSSPDLPTPNLPSSEALTIRLEAEAPTAYSHPPEPPAPLPRPLAAGGNMRRIIGVLYRLASVLAAVHRTGIVHRDLKPSNVLVTRDNQPVLVDFGLVQRNRSSRDVLEEDQGSIVGTALYMAPEQFLGEVVDARADLYAFGCILYESLTGEPPFRGERYVELVRLHLFGTPSRLRDRVAKVPQELDDLVSRLLSKRPQLRPGHAVEILQVMRKLWPELDPDGAIVQKIDHAFTPYRPALAGRKAELDRLNAQLEKLQSGEGSMVVLEGPGGSGKTRLMVELLRLARQQRCTIVTSEPMPQVGTGEKESQAAPLHALLGVLRTVEGMCRNATALDTRQLLGDELVLVAQFLPSLRTLPGASNLPPAPALPAEGARMRLTQAVVRIIERTVASDPLVLMIDDLQWADDLSIAVLAGLARRNFASMRILIVASVR
ncbi:MAG: serine/threonine protein kinase, partial [Nannocystaceae bacterium]